MKIVVLDGHTLNPGDLSWDALRTLGNVELHPRSTPEEIAPRLAQAEATLTNKVPLGPAVFEACPKLRYIGVTATGFNIVDIAAAKARNITVTNVPAYGTASVAQATIALLLELTNRVGHHADTVRAGRWNRCPDFCYWDHPLIELQGLKLGIIGFGRIGAAVAALAQAFGMEILVQLRQPKSIPNGYRAVDLETLLRESDVVSLHCPLTDQTRHLLNAARLALMKRTAFLLNTSRGPLIDEAALAAALRAGQLAGAGLDVLAVEPPKDGNPLFDAPNCYLTPHFAWATQAARSRLMSVTVENLRRFLAGQPVNVVS